MTLVNIIRNISFDLNCSLRHYNNLWPDLKFSIDFFPALKCKGRPFARIFLRDRNEKNSETVIFDSTGQLIYHNNNAVGEWYGDWYFGRVSNYSGGRPTQQQKTDLFNKYAKQFTQAKNLTLYAQQF